MNTRMIRFQVSALVSLILMASCGPSPTSTSTTSSASVEERLSNLEKEVIKLGQSLGATTGTGRASTISPTASPSSETNAVKEIKIQPETLLVKVGENVKPDLVLLVMGNDQTTVAPNLSVFTITSSDTSVATVNGSGQITGIKTGAAIITLKLGTVSKTVGVIVSAAGATPTPSPSATVSASATPTPTPTPSPTATPATGIKSVSVDPESYSISIGQSTVVKSIIVVLDSGDFGTVDRNGGNVTLKSKNTNIATIDSAGVIFGTTAGVATMTVTYKGIAKDFTVTVTATPTPSP